MITRLLAILTSVAACLGAGLHAQQPAPPPASAPSQRTLTIIKPNAVRLQQSGAILKKLEESNLRVIAMKMIKLTPRQAGEFYKEHEQRPFYRDLVASMSSGPIVVAVLEGQDTIRRHREVMGATDPAKAAAGTIRKEFGKDVTNNAIHGSDSPTSAAREIAFFFSELELNP